MRQTLLSQIEQTLPAIAATAKVEFTELPALSSAREAAGSAFLRHKQLREATARNIEQARRTRALIRLLGKLDAVYVGLPKEGNDEYLGEDVGDEHLHRVLRLVEAAVANLEANNDKMFPFMSRFSISIASIVRVFKKIQASQARLVANSAGDLVNAMISAVEANRDLLLALRVLRTRLETELTGTGKPANSVGDVERFLAETWT